MSGKKKEPNPNSLLSGDLLLGVFHVKGRGPKSSVCPSKPRETKLFWWDIPGFGWDIPAAPEKFEKKRSVFNFWPHIKRKKGVAGGVGEGWGQVE